LHKRHLHNTKGLFGGAYILKSEENVEHSEHSRLMHSLVYVFVLLWIMGFYSRITWF